MKNLILNSQYKSPKYFFNKAKGDLIFLDKKRIIDLSFCSGAILLGHNHPVFKKSIKEYLNNNYSIFSHPNTQAIKLSRTIKKFFPNFEKIIFCNTGSESVIKALRVSRTINSKKKIVSVAGSWHGSSDQTLFSPNKNFNPLPISAGLKESDRKRLIYIPYNNIEHAKKILNKHKKNINCIIIEPVMGCLPINDPIIYLKFLEKYCLKNNINLIFDEIITGFRSKNGSVQGKYKIKPDITLIGKALGGGLPISAVGVSKRVYDKIKKSKKKIFFGGTFSANTLSAFVGNKVTTHIADNKDLIAKLILKSKYFEESVNNYIKKENLNAKIYRFDSILRIVFSKKKINSRIQRDFLEKNKSKPKRNFEIFLLKKNIHLPSNGIILFSIKTNKKNINYVIDSVCKGLKKFFNKG